MKGAIHGRPPAPATIAGGESVASQGVECRLQKGRSPKADLLLPPPDVIAGGVEKAQRIPCGYPSQEPQHLPGPVPLSVKSVVL